MPTILLALFMAFLLISTPCVTMATPLKTYVAEFNVAGAPRRRNVLTDRLDRLARSSQAGVPRRNSHDR